MLNFPRDHEGVVTKFSKAGGGIKISDAMTASQTVHGLAGQIQVPWRSAGCPPHETVVPCLDTRHHPNGKLPPPPLNHSNSPYVHVINLEGISIVAPNIHPSSNTGAKLGKLERNIFMWSLGRVSSVGLESAESPRAVDGRRTLGMMGGPVRHIDVNWGCFVSGEKKADNDKCSR